MTRKVRGGAGTLRISIANPLLRAFNSAIHDPTRNRPQYGRASRIISDLLTNWLRSQGKPTEIHDD